MISPARSHKSQRACPSGALLQTNAVIWSRCSPEISTGYPERDVSCRQRKPIALYLSCHTLTVCLFTLVVSVTAVSIFPRSNSSNPIVRRKTRDDCFPFLASDSHVSRSDLLSCTCCFFILRASLTLTYMSNLSVYNVLSSLRIS